MVVVVRGACRFEALWGCAKGVISFLTLLFFFCVIQFSFCVFFVGLFVGGGDVYGEGLVWLVRGKVVGRVKVQGGWCRIEGLGRAKVNGCRLGLIWG